MTVATPMIEVRGLGKMFTLHNQGGIRLPVLEAVDFDAAAGDCLVLAGPSGTGKSTLLRCLYGNYLATEGSIRVRAGDDWVELVGAPEQRILALRRDVIGYVSQFLRVIPRVSALDVVAEPLRMAGIDAGEARERAAAMLRRLNVPQRLWGLAPATFSGGEQQRVNIARGFIARHPILLLDEPTASLDPDNRAVVVALIREARAAGRCLLGIFHDEEVRDAVASRVLALRPAQAAVELE
ncbi:phosphonate C-P lyase system protein PhnL [Achromobacter xylosoxidans]|jgi:alpha-D-ribose 1-methylphosphonate 5-triphosphate synthase subunit PhnL|uniref:Phosphonate C-P lyase system protein PhnL n=3 Tax=Alcaligenes xylosoxydans xylosoxydans TaxID=85698 RepID=A0A0M7DBL2_ALCXX|nr:MULTISPECIES: phosphonate C-P lyase system protein PhnL [Achromobacter]KWU17185.1 alpha-D-ribose 1-methylphosphonate 5-triphosphate synthase subunit PhnL [Achromobacter xylosoxidans]MBK1981834.1 phosphonate C-P lyase system protein PhnL [Achromobacter xylosoxidans]MCH1987657.1 phosphonate C-P lyase system protein PhnL [Achromobacter xylosoxidans]MCH1991758.1 phosphonate C-P lyase system protein PhnL [Achromobacter xylosoxidans]MCH4575654.1 phosphonate C-P lyase system protein PhnL [Achromob